MRSRFRFASALLASALLVGGCATRPARINPDGTVSVSLQTDKKLSALTMRFGYLLALTLPPAAPEYQWAIAFHDTRFLKQMSNLIPAKTAEAGATVSFYAQKTGGTRLRFLLLPLNAGRSVDPVDIQELILTIE